MEDQQIHVWCVFELNRITTCVDVFQNKYAHVITSYAYHIVDMVFQMYCRIPPNGDAGTGIWRRLLR